MTTPNWISSLSTGWMAVDVTAATATGTTNYSGLLKLFQDLATNVTSRGAGLTSSEFSDLHTIVSNLNTAVSTSSYLTSIANAFVNGSSLNAKWTGGATNSITLGNLNIGSTGTQISELVGKWFLGTDLPSNQVTAYGTTYPISYHSATVPLFASTGPSMSDINQGQIGDCYLLSSLAEMAYQNPNLVRSMITDNGNNSYGVRFYYNGQAQYVTVNNQVASGTNFNLNTGPALWSTLVEKAYTTFVGATATTGNSYTTTGNGGWPEDALATLTGTRVTDIRPNGSSWITNGQSLSNDQAAALISANLLNGNDVILTSWTNATDAQGRLTLCAAHAMSVYGYDSSTGMLQIRNPWGSETWQSWDTTFEVSLSTLLAAGDTISIDSAGAGHTTHGTAPHLTAQTSAQVWNMGQSVSFTLAANTFTDPQGEALTYSATLADGSALPSWLSFNAATRTFSGTVPNTTTSLNLKVTATDTENLSSSETFNVSTQAQSPYVAHQTGSLTMRLARAFSFSLASNTFVDPQGQALTYSVSTSQGGLPSWLHCNTSSLSFWGTAPRRATNLTVYASATDTSGLSASESFNLSVRRGAAILTQAVASAAPTSAIAAGAAQHQASAATISLASPHA